MPETGKPQTIGNPGKIWQFLQLPGHQRKVVQLLLEPKLGAMDEALRQAYESLPDKDKQAVAELWYSDSEGETAPARANMDSSPANKEAPSQNKPPDTERIFEQALDFVLRWEGGFVDDPADRGGATNQGVTQDTYNHWRHSKGLPKQSVKQLTEEERDSIYREDYWEAGHCPEVSRSSPELAVAHFDWCVNAGVGRGVQTLQYAVGSSQDGAWGPNTKQAVANASPREAVSRYNSKREQLYRSWGTGSQQRFLQGWLNRLNDLRKFINKGDLESPVLGEVDEEDSNEANTIELPGLGVRSLGDSIFGTHFDWNEATEGGNRIPREQRIVSNVQDLADKLEGLREFLSQQFGQEVPLAINSWYRPPEVNERVGGASNSQHLYGKAADVVPKGINIHAAQRVAEKYWLRGEKLGGFGRGANKGFLHFDTGPPRSWGY